MHVDIKVALIAAYSELVTTLIANFFQRHISKKELIEKYRMIYFENQLAAYRKFWSILKPISKYLNLDSPIVKEGDMYYLDLQKCQKFSDEITDFFFSSDGVLLDRETRIAMFDVRDHLEDLMTKYQDDTQSKIQITSQEAKDFRRLRDPLFNAVRSGSNLINLEFQAN